MSLEIIFGREEIIKIPDATWKLLVSKWAWDVKIKEFFIAQV